MTVVFQPWQLLWAIVVGWINEYSQRRIDYLQTELTAVKEAYGPRRILLTDDQRRRLAVKGKRLGRKALSEIGSVFSPDTSFAGTGNSSPESGISRLAERRPLAGPRFHKSSWIWSFGSQERTPPGVMTGLPTLWPWWATRFRIKPSGMC